MNTRTHESPRTEPLDYDYTPAGPTSGVNINQDERAPSAVLGAALLLLGLKRHSLVGTAVALAGGSLIYRGISGRCKLYKALGISTAEHPAAGYGSHEAGAPSDAAEVERSITIGKPAEELYRLWLEPRTLSQVMGHFAEVTQANEDTQHWRVHGPGGRTLEWDSRVVEDIPAECLRWWSLEGAQLPNEGSVRFRPAPGDRGTEVTLHFCFDPPGGGLGDALMKLLGAVPRLLAFKALQRFKSLAETGEMPTLEHNPSGRTGATANIV